MILRDTHMAAQSEEVSLTDESMSDSRLVLDRLIALCREDISRTDRILRDLQSSLAIRGTDGGIVVPRPIAALGQEIAETSLSVTIRDEEGQPLAFLDIAHRSDEPRFFRVLAERTARSISERWFRMVHRRNWVLAALRDDDPNTFILVAANREHRLVGADHHARRIMAAAGRPFRSGLGLSRLFRIGALSYRTRRYCDAATRLIGVSDDATWSALITPPDPVMVKRDEQLLIHTRPRLDTIGSRKQQATIGPRRQGGLAMNAVRRLREHIETHIESSLRIEDLAVKLEMSTGHFSRAFRASVGMPPHNYIMRRRVARAQELLTETDLNLAAVALRCGFADQSHLTNRFREIAGVTLRTYRAERSGRFAGKKLLTSSPTPPIARNSAT